MALDGSVPLGTAVEGALDEGFFHRLKLIRFDLPSGPVGYHNGGRPFTYNGLTYQPNRYLDPGSLEISLGMSVTKRTVRFSNVPTADPSDSIAQLEALNYPNRTVVISTLLGDPATQEPLGVLISQVYEIDSATYPVSEMDEDGQRTLNVLIDLEPPSRATRDKTLAVRSLQEHQFDNAADDTFLAQASTRVTVQREWGQR